MGRRYLPLVGVISVIAFILITSNLIYAQEKSDKKEDSKKTDTEGGKAVETEDEKTVETEKKGKLLKKSKNPEIGQKLFFKKSNIVFKSIYFTNNKETQKRNQAYSRNN